MFEKLQKNYAEKFYFLFRVVVGLMFALHGAQKFGLIGDGNVAGFAGIFGFPVWIAFLVSFVELVGGLGILFGFFTRLSALGGAIVMLWALATVHFPQGWNPLGNGGELPLLFTVSFLMFMLYGAGKWSLEKALLKKEFF
ncbi:DoxX family protein [Candidatus Woesearchaeota archaeon]|nr:DoxX family protein [Candidatus Woesearchaeota archaeon]